ncbi:MAG: LAGLIDADG family homing endonuclease, partial [Candidatus Woesearchaeota archaeon]
VKRRKQNGFYYEIDISGHLKDKCYHMEYVNGLIHKLFGVKFNQQILEQSNILMLRKQSQAICLFLKNVFGLSHNKNNVVIPELVLKSDLKTKSAFLRGLADSDFCFTVKYKPHAYPVIHGTSKSEQLIRQYSDILSELGVQNYVQKEKNFYVKRNKEYPRYRVYINGGKRVKRFMDRVGFQNPNKVKKYELFLEKAYCL